MDMSKFLKALSNSELIALQESLILERISRLDITEAPPLTKEEVEIISSKGKVQAIIAYRSRTNQTVLVSKLVVDGASER